MKQHRPLSPGLGPSSSAGGRGPVDLDELDDQDVLGNAAIQALLGGSQGAAAGGATEEATANQTDDPGKQTVGGTWSTAKYEPYIVPNGDGDSRGCSIELEFMPNGLVDAEQIDLVQTCRAMVVEEPGATAAPYYLDDPEREARATSAEDGGVGWHIDSNGGDVSPLYGVDTYEEGTPLAAQGDAARLNHASGRCTIDQVGGKSVVRREAAMLKDGPKLQWEAGKSYTMSFETAALCTAGAQEGAWYGSVEWGCSVDATGKIELDAFDVCEQGGPSTLFTAASRRWNDSEAEVSPDHNPALSAPTKMATTDLPLDGRSIDPTDGALRARAIRVEALEAIAEVSRLKTERIRYVDREKNRLKATMTEREWTAHLHQRFDGPVADLEARLRELAAAKAALGTK